MTAMTETKPGRAMTIVRVVLIAGGVGLLGLGGLVLLLDVNPARYLGIALWFAGAIVIHDALIAPGVFVAGIVLRRLGRKLPGAVIAIIQAAIVVIAIVTAIVVPEILKKDIGSANPTILPLDYLPNLAVFSLVTVVATLAAIVLYVVIVARREKSRPSIDQD